MTFCSLFVAIIAVFSQISIPMPSMVPLTLQTFIIALTGYYLGLKSGLISLAVYVALGAVGVPVFSNFKGGFSVLIGPTGGFIWGFFVIVIFCSFPIESRILKIIFGMISILICHLLGILQYMLYAGKTFVAAFILVSLPYLLKDFASIILAYIVSITVLKRVKPYREKK